MYINIIVSSILSPEQDYDFTWVKGATHQNSYSAQNIFQALGQYIFHMIHIY